MQKSSKYGQNDKNQQNRSSLCSHCSAVYGDILIVKVVLELYRPVKKILLSCQPSSTKLALVNFLKNSQKLEKLKISRFFFHFLTVVFAHYLQNQLTDFQTDFFWWSALPRRMLAIMGFGLLLPKAAEKLAKN